MLSEQPAAPAPITSRPLPLIDLLDGAFAALRQRPRTLVSVVAGFVVPLSIVTAVLGTDPAGGLGMGALLNNDPSRVDNSMTVTDVAILYGLGWLTTAVCGVPISAIVGGWLIGEDTSARQAVRLTLRRLPTILGAFLLIHVIEVVGTLLLILPGLAALVFFSLTSPVIALENLGPWESMKRSMTLVRRRSGTVIGVIVLTGIASVAISNAVGLLPDVVAGVLGADRSRPVIALSSMLSSLILVPFTSAAMCLTYLELRFRTEGFDLELRAQRPPSTVNGR